MRGEKCMREFAFRGLEFHSSRMWQWAQVERALEFMQDMNLNALIFHESELVDNLVLPKKYFSTEFMWKKNPVRYHVLMNNVLYMNKVARESKEKGIDFFPEIKEIFYPDGLLELFPELRNDDGTICATHPFWWDFVEAKVSELVELVPDLAGLIVSAGTRESMVSISANECECERCRNYDPVIWYANLLQAMYTPLIEKGKTLTVRDFSYSADQQSYIVNAATKVSEDIIISLKNTPHDYYPTFPHNPEIGNVGNHAQWVEFDTWGQFYGVGFFPASVVEDMKSRMNHCHNQNVTGIYLRTDWENLTEGSVFNSFNILNLISGACISNNIDIDTDEIYRRWADYGLLSPLKSGSCLQNPVPTKAPDSYKMLRDFMKASWSVIEKAIYVRGHVFHEDCMFPDTVQIAFDMMVKIHSRDEWDEGASKLVEPTDENIKVVFAEKTEAVEEVRKLPSLLQVEKLGIPQDFKEEIMDLLDLYELYVRGFNLTTRSCFLTKKAMLTKDVEDVKKAEESIIPLVSYRTEVLNCLEGTHYPHYVYWLLDTNRLQFLINDIQSQLKVKEGTK